jgi:hypothetical protein
MRWAMSMAAILQPTASPRSAASGSSLCFILRKAIQSSRKQRDHPYTFLARSSSVSFTLVEDHHLDLLGLADGKHQLPAKTGQLIIVGDDQPLSGHT